MNLMHDTGPAYLDGQPIVSVSLDVQQDRIETTGGSEPDPNWAHIDAAGHFHAWTKTGTLPSLKRTERTVQCGVDEDDESEPWSYSINEYRCRLCDELVEPGYRTVNEPQYKPGLKRWTATVVTPHRPEARMVSLWSEGSRPWFGIGAITSTIHDGQMWTLTVTGNGELGQR